MASLSTMLGALAAAAPAAADLGDARLEFEEGRVALVEGRLVDAREHLRAAYELFPHRATAFNLLVALRGLERPSEAAPLCTALLGGRFGPLGGTEEQQVRAVCQSVDEQWARVQVSITGAARAIVSVDGHEVGEVERGALLEQRLDPGSHVIEIVAAGHAGEERHVVLSRGESLRIDVPVVSLMAMPSELVDASSSGSAWPWVLAAGGAVVAVAAFVVVLVMSGSGGQDQTTSDWFPDEPAHGFAP